MATLDLGRLKFLNRGTCGLGTAERRGPTETLLVAHAQAMCALIEVQRERDRGEICKVEGESGARHDFGPRAAGCR